MKRTIIFALVIWSFGCTDKKEQIYKEQMNVVRKIFSANGLDPEVHMREGIGTNPHTDQVSRLVFPNKGLKEIPADIGKLTALTHLDLAGNEIQTLPSEIGNLKNLKELDLGQNNLTTLPESIGNLQELERLDVGDNELNFLPQSIGSLTNLEDLWVAGNQLSALPDSLSGLTKVSYINLVQNDFSEFPRSLLEMPNFSSILADADEIDTSNLPEGVKYQGNGSFVYIRSPK